MKLVYLREVLHLSTKAQCASYQTGYKIDTIKMATLIVKS